MFSDILPPETLISQTWQNACLRIALELGVFDMLVAKKGTSVGVQELASANGADAVFLGKYSTALSILSYLYYPHISPYHESRHSPWPLH